MAVANIAKLIPALNKLQDAFATLDLKDKAIDLPQIAVVGGQSAGKSTVLESVVGKSFLPRGSGIVTRRPLQLQLINLPNKNDQEYGVFNHCSSKRFYKFEDIRDEITAETDRTTLLDGGMGRDAIFGVSSKPIILTVYSPDVLTLSIVDLPGLTKVPVAGQPETICDDIKDMVMEYISRPNTIILAVTPANTDVANSDALALARKVDPDGERTLGVFTKADMPTNSDVAKALRNEEFYLKLGYIGVANPSPLGKDGKPASVDELKDLRKARSAEEEFFANTPPFNDRQVFKDCLGTAALERRLSETFAFHATKCAPELMKQTRVLIDGKRHELKSLGGEPMDITQRLDRLLEVLFQFAGEFQGMIDGSSGDLPDTELQGGSRINYVYCKVFKDDLNAVDIRKNVKPEDIRTIIRNVMGDRPGLFISNDAFELAIKGQIPTLIKPTQKCVDLVYSELHRIAIQILDKSTVFKALPSLKVEVKNVAEKFLQHCYDRTKEYVLSLIEMEQARINTNHPHFEYVKSTVTGSNDMGLEFDKGSLGRLSANTPKKDNNNNLTPKKEGATDKPRSSVSERPGQFKAGLLEKLGGNGDKWQTRYVKVETSALTYSEPKSNGECGAMCGKLLFGPGTKIDAAHDVQKTKTPLFCFRISGAANEAGKKKEAYVFGTKSETERKEWMDALQCAIDGKVPTSIQGPPPGKGQWQAGDYRLPQKLEAGDVESDGEKVQLLKIHHLLLGYFDVVRTNVEDIVPKAITLLLVNQSKKFMQKELMQTLYKSELVDELFAVTPALEEARRKASDGLVLMESAYKTMEDVSSSLGMTIRSRAPGVASGA